MEKRLDLSNSVHTLCTLHPELIPILRDLGFTDITKPGMLMTAGQFMTIKKGAILKKIPLQTIVDALHEHGFTVEERNGNE